ncbi:MAG: helix-turn-helix domain-containing protein [Deinococcus-Thermus bacterium]|jgi:AraC-like DNA-binding protein|nr:helix-turn-helix domain-containing protein [Deinococcota bacterium]
MIVSRPPRDPRLAPLIACLWAGWRVDGPAVERVLPTGGLQIVVDLDRGEAVVTGPRTRFTLVPAARMRHTAGLAFTIGGARPVLGLPAVALRGAEVPLAEVIGGTAAGRLVDALTAPVPPDRLLDRLEADVRRCLAKAEGADARMGPDPAVAATLATLAETGRVGDAVRLTGLSRPTLARRFDAAVGLAPKAWAGLVRLQRASHALARGRPPLADLALACGFADQAHFSRAFAAYAGRPPGAWHALSPEEPNHAAA